MTVLLVLSSFPPRGSRCS